MMHVLLLGSHCLTVYLNLFIFQIPWYLYLPWITAKYFFSLHPPAQYDFVNEKHKDVIESIEKEKKLDDAMEEKIKALIEEYKGLFQA